jgi:hypothetical protein
MLSQSATFPLLRVYGSDWLKQFDHIYPERAHFVLITADDVFQVIAKSQVLAEWQ